MEKRMFSFRVLLSAALAAGLSYSSELTEAVRNQDRAAVQRLARTRALVNQAEADGATPLHWAADMGDAGTVSLLLNAGANPSMANRLGITPLYLAASNRHADVARLLLKAGASVSTVTTSGETILMAAARSGDPALVSALLDAGADVKAVGAQFGETALMIAASENQPAVVDLLTRRGSDPNERSKAFTYTKDRFGLEGVLTILPRGGWTALMYAARQGATEAVLALSRAKADLNLKDADGSTALHFAILNGHFDTAAALIETGADIKATDNSGVTALYAAVDMNTLGEVFGRPPRAPSGRVSALDLMMILFARGADPNAQLTAATIQRAHTPGEPTLGAGATALMRAAKTGDVASIELLIAHGADVNLAAKNGVTPLMFACGLGRGVSAFAKDTGTEAELLAAGKLLVAHGADINAKSVAGLTPIHYAAQAADANFPQPTDAMLLFLLEKGANVNVTDSQGRTPVEMAMGKGLRGRAGGPVKPREETAAMLRKKMNP
jgi:ankyrin repeat protein